MSNETSSKDVLSNARSRETMGLYQSRWMAHWTQMSSKTLSQGHDYKTVQPDEKHEEQDVNDRQKAAEIADHMKLKVLDVDASLGDASRCMNKWKDGVGGFKGTFSAVQPAEGMASGSGGTKIRFRNMSMIGNIKNSISRGLKSTQLEFLSKGKLLDSSVDHENCSVDSHQCFRNRNFEQKNQNFDFHDRMGGILSSCQAPIDEFKTQRDAKSKSSTADRFQKVPQLQERVLTLLPNDIHVKQGWQGLLNDQSKHDFIDKNALPILTPLHGDHMLSNFNVKISSPREYDTVSNADVLPKGHVGSSHSTYADCEHSNFQCHSMRLASETDIDRKLMTESSRCQRSKKKDEAVQPYNYSTIKDFQFPMYLREQGENLEEFSVMRLLPSHKSHEGTSDGSDSQPLLHRMPTCCLHNMETLQIRTTVNSVEGLAGVPAKFSKTTHHLFITKKADMNLSKGNKMIKESKFFNELEGGSFCKMLTPTPDFGNFHGERKFPCLGDSAHGEEEEEDAKMVITCSQNESSAETDSLPMDFNHSNDPPVGSNFTSHEDLVVGTSRGKPVEAVGSQNKGVGTRMETAELPDINELPIDLAMVRSSDWRELSTSRTESLDVEHLLSHVEQPEISNSTQPGNYREPEPSSRWVKRLRLSTSDSHALGTKSLKIGDSSSSGKVNKLFNKIAGYSRTNSELMLGGCHGKGLKKFDNNVTLLRSMDSSRGLFKNHQDLMQSHPWIHRWCHVREPAKCAGPATHAPSEPKNSKFSMDELQKKHFPSIAAMALMGKAVSNFRPCEFRKSRSLLWWSS